ncbi:hypothetical protein ACFQ2M_32985 [Kitasatospora saccharophila]|uniref:hypothetical protein n=1 Tax=Kitasatospora saccharophila TaxID=407973 RepID=UPI00363A41C6
MTTRTTFSLTEAAAAEGLAVARRTLELLRGVPEFGDRYAAAAPPGTLAELAALPPLAKDDLNTALAHLEPAAEHGATWLFQSGGSTGRRRSATRRPGSTWRRCSSTGSRWSGTTCSSTPGARAGCGARTSWRRAWPTCPAAG